MEVCGDVLAEELEDVGLVCGCVFCYEGTEAECDDAGDAGTEFEDGGGGGEEVVGEEEVCGGGDPGGEEGGYFPYYCARGPLFAIRSQQTSRLMYDQIMAGDGQLESSSLRINEA